MEAFIGSIIIFAGNFAPNGWAMCDGTLLPISQYAAVFSLLGTTYGGNGVTNFALPNLKGRAPVHPGQLSGGGNYVLGQQGGTENTSLTINNMPVHTHATTVTIQASASSQSPSADPTGSVLVGGTNVQIFAPTPDGTTMNPGMATAQVTPAGGSQPFSIASPYTCLNFIICLQGIFPSRP